MSSTARNIKAISVRVSQYDLGKNTLQLALKIYR